MSLPEKYEPETLDGLEGNDALKDSLGTMLARKRVEIPHVFLFTGGPGCGKTTLGNIVGRALGCHMKFDFHEMNVADLKGIDNIRDIRDQVRYKSMTGGPCVIWMLDECHKLTGDAQNALLKILEPKHIPKHCYFIFSTTDPQKLLPALKQRCTTYEVKPLDDDQMLDYLEYVCKSEKKKVPEDVLRQLTMDGGGSIRNTLQILERIIDLPVKEMAAAAVQIEETEIEVKKLCQILLKDKVKWKEVAAALAVVKGEPEDIRNGVFGYCASILVKGVDNSKAALIMNCFKEPFYNNKRNGVVLACYEAICG
jgi:DNA polymerase III subunit gamma/tau